jgi:hypothetical protein
MTGPNEPTRLAALGRQVERTSRRMGELDILVRQLSADVTALSRRLGVGSPEPGDPDIDPDTEADTPGAVRAWLLAGDPEQAAADLTDLISWLHRIYLRYHGAALTSCWLWHSGVIEELWWLRRAHAEAYDPRAGSWLRVGDWHDRQRPNVVRRINAALRSCDLELHVTGGEQDRPPAVVPLAGAAAGIAASWVDSGQHVAPPAPSTQQRAEAAEHFKSLHRRRS